ncbi:hypothetical protein [Pseudomonas sp. HS-18]|uniref:hypothetical protein n=1 Tax=Pseudomonas sp. HS-18 TaxID=2879114 RepID=UPI001CF06CCB|nr:hypothetical protein [Pseudomonas sp. HS-18]UCL84542.1 hypothetical protein LDJ84_16315 [Pseudomonas sp. HS-18]
MSHTLEKVMRVYDEEGVYIEIRQNPDSPTDSLELHTTGSEACEAWYGKQSIMLTGKEHALALAKAITEMAEMIQ